MSGDFREQIYKSFDQKPTNELIEIWQINNHVEWSEITFDVIREILQKRLVELPPQNEPIIETNKPDKGISDQATTMTLLQLYFSFDGRIGLETYWLKGILPIFILSIIAGFIEATIPSYSSYSGIPGILLRVLIFWPSMALTVKRWHDRGKSGWWILMGIIPIIGLLWAFIETSFLAGTNGKNPYGLKSF